MNKKKGTVAFLFVCGPFRDKHLIQYFSRCGVLASTPHSKNNSHGIILAKMAINLLFRSSQPAAYLPIRFGCSVLFLLKLRKTVVRLFSRCDILSSMPRSKKVSHGIILAKMATNLLFRSSQPATYLPIRLGWSLLAKRRYSSILAKNLGEIYNKNTLGTMCLQGVFL